MFIQLNPALAQAWRSPGVLQLGLGEQSGLVLSDLDAGDLAILEALADGVSSRSRLAGQARFLQLVTLLEGMGAIVRHRSRAVALNPGEHSRRVADEAAWALVAPEHQAWPVLASRGERRVQVLGHGRIAAAIALSLAAAGIGRVESPSGHEVLPSDVSPCGVSATEVTMTHREAVTAGIARLGVRQRHGLGLRDDAHRFDLVVLVEPDAADALSAAPWMRDGVDHLSVVSYEGRMRVGPLVRPGRDACLHCLDLHRTDIDPAWPQVLAQVLRRRQSARGVVGGTPIVAEELLIGQVAASIAALYAVVHLDGVHPSPLIGSTWEIGLPDAHPERREWPVHPACGCAGPSEVTMES